MYPEILEGFDIFGVVKETVDECGLLEFSSTYFRSYPLFVDKSYCFYQALGDRKVGFGSLLNPIALVGILCDAVTRLSKKSISGNVMGEGIVQGGLIVFGPDRQPVAMYPEETGQDLRIADLAAALQVIRRRASSSGVEKDNSA